MRPRWLVTKDIGVPVLEYKKRAARKGFLDKTIGDVASLVKNSVFLEEYASRKGLLQRIDPRVKVLTMAVLLISVSLLKYPLLIGGLYLFILILAMLSEIPLKFFLLRVWLFVPIFSGIIAIPALFNVFVPGEPVLILAKFQGKWSIGPIKIPEVIAITKQGSMAALIFVMRVATSVSLVVLLVLTTRWSYLLKALRVFCVPQIFTFIISMTYRYIHLLLRLIEDVLLAKKSRVIRKSSVGEGQRWVSSQMGTMMKRSLKMSEDVYSAMVSRGFTNEVRVVDSFKIGRVDYLWSIFFILFVSLVMGLNRIWG